MREQRRQEWLASLPRWLHPVPDFGVAVLRWNPPHVTMKGVV